MDNNFGGGDFDKDKFLSNLLSFDKMITPSIIQTLYYIVLVVLVLMGISMLFKSFMRGLIFIFVAPLLARVQFELLIIIFKIHENLDALRKINQQQLQNMSKE